MDLKSIGVFLKINSEICLEDSLSLSRLPPLSSVVENKWYLYEYSLMKKSSTLIFALMVTLLGSTIFSCFRFFVFSPFLVYVYYRVSFKRALWIALGCGFIIDMVSSGGRLGIYMTSFFCTTLLLYRQKSHFFEDRGVPFSVFTAIHSFFLTLICGFATLIVEHKFFFSASFCVVDLLVMSILDGVYAFLWFFFILNIGIYHRKNKLLKVNNL